MSDKTNEPPLSHTECCDGGYIRDRDLEQRVNALEQKLLHVLKVRIIDEKGQVVWERGEGEGVACRAYAKDGTQQAIIRALANALSQAEGELSSFKESICSPRTLRD